VVTYFGLTAAWSCGVFARATVVTPHSLLAHGSAVVVALLAWAACLLYSRRVDQLSPAGRKASKSVALPGAPKSVFNSARETILAGIYRRLRRRARKPGFRIFLTGLGPLLSVLAFAYVFVIPIESALRPENRVLTYWRAINLWSGLSP